MVICAIGILSLERSAADERPLQHRLQQVPAPGSVLCACARFILPFVPLPRGKRLRPSGEEWWLERNWNRRPFHRHLVKLPFSL
ncbi:hypothetical protein ACLOJK_008461 [Asimina triloba]